MSPALAGGFFTINPAGKPCPLVLMTAFCPVTRCPQHTQPVGQSCRLQLLCSCRWWASSQPGLCTSPNVALWYTFPRVKIAGSKVTATWRICRHVSRSPFAGLCHRCPLQTPHLHSCSLLWLFFLLLCQAACDILVPPVRDQTHTPCPGNTASQPLGHWGSPLASCTGQGWGLLLALN